MPLNYKRTHLVQLDCIQGKGVYKPSMFFLKHSAKENENGLSGGLAVCRLLRESMPMGCLSLLVGLMVFVGSELAACSVPVFRFALERWDPDSYGVIVFHRGSLSPEEQSLIDRMDSSEVPTSQFLNASVTSVDLAESMEPEALALWEAQGTETLPWMMVSFPWSRLAADSVFAGPLTKGSVDQVVDSPVRREVARRLLKGESAVWVFLESGDTDQDDQAHDRLNSRLEHLTAKLELPLINPVDIEEGLISIDEDQLKIEFSTIRLSRDDPSEAFFVQNLLGSEDDLTEFDEPIAFPIFGRGRVLYGLIGDGIAPDVIDEACVFLTGSCSCEVKEQNPGVDLVMSVDWDRLVSTQFDIDRELPPLSGFVGLSADSSETVPSAVAEESSTKVSSESNLSESGEKQPAEPFVFNTLLICAMIGFGTLGVGAFLLLKR